MCRSDLHTKADRLESKREETQCNAGFIDLENTYDKVNMEALWQALRMCDVGDKLLSGIKSMYADSSACVRVKWGKSERFRIDRGVRQGCIMSTCLFNVYIDGVRRRESFLEDGREWRLPSLLYADDLVLCSDSEEGLRVMVDGFLWCVEGED